MNVEFKMQWSTPPIEPVTNSSGTINFDDLSVINDPQDGDYLLIYDVSQNLNYKITKSVLTGQTALIQSINDLDLIGNEMIYAASPNAFTKVNTSAYGRSLLTSSSVNELRATLELVPGVNIQAYSSDLTAFATSASSASNNDIFYYNSGSFNRITLSDYARDTLLLGTSAANLGFATYTTTTDNVIPKWNGSTGALQNTGISVSDSDDITGINSLNTTVTSAILSELGNIGATTINSTQWGYVGALNQGLTSSSDVNFNSVTTTTTLNVGSTSTFGGNLNANSNKIINLAAPTSGSDAANKTYVDNVAASGITPLEQAYAATTANLTSTYNNTGGNNSRGSLTATGNGAISIDGTSPSVNARILVKNQSTLAQNGVYIVQSTGDGSNPYILERSSDFYSGVAPVSQNTFILVTNGTVNSGTGWLLAATVTTFGTDDVSFVGFSSQFTAGDGLEVIGGNLNVVTPGTSGNIYVNGSNQIDINGALAISKGGTNATSYTADRLIAYNSGGTAFETTSLQPSTVVSLTGVQELTYKTIDSTTNTVTADALWDKVGSKISIDNTPSAIGQVLKMSSLAPNQAQWLTESVDINGLTETTSSEGVDELVIYDNSLSANRKITRTNFLSGITRPSGTIVVASSGGDYTTISAAIAASSAGNVIVVYPGTYTENITIPSGVRIVGYPNAQNVIIAGTSTGARVTMSATSTLRNVTVYGPATGSNPAIDCSGLQAGNLAVLFEVVLIGQGSSGAGLIGSGSGIVAILNVYHNGGAFGQVFDLSSGNVIGTHLITNVGTVTDIIRLSGNVSFHLLAVLLNDASLYSCTDIFDISSTGFFELGMLIIPDNTPAINGFHITGDGVDISCVVAHLHVSGFSILVDPELTGSGSQITIQGEITRSSISMPSGYPNGCTAFIVCGIDKGTLNDPTYFFANEVAIGTVANPSELAVGEGDSVTDNMYVFSYDGTSTYVDNTTSAKTRINDSFNFFQAVTTGNIAYIGNSQRNFPNIKANIDTAMVLGSGTTVWEYWNGSSWTSFNIMSTLSEYPYTQQASRFFTSTSSEQIRFNSEILTDWATTTVNSRLAYWVRVRITATITTIPVIQRIKLGTNRTEINSDGTIEFFGQAEKLTTQRFSNPHLSTGTPATASFNISSSIASFQNDYSQFDYKSNEGQGYLFIAPAGIDTSRVVTINIDWTKNSAGSGNITLIATLVPAITTGTNVKSGALTQQSSSTTIAVPGTVGVLQRTTFTFDISSTLVDDTLIFQILRSTTSNTYTSTISIFAVSLTYTRWS